MSIAWLEGYSDGAALANAQTVPSSCAMRMDASASKGMQNAHGRVSTCAVCDRELRC